MVIEKEKLDLTNSPIYNLSMCSLENFHTCFLKWLGGIYPNETLNLFLPQKQASVIKFDSQFKLNNNCIFDLYVKIENDREEILVIENKLKSYPTEKQLNNYTEGLSDKKAHFVLLSLAPMKNLPNKWKSISYLELAQKMHKTFDNFIFQNEYHKYLINDYIKTIEYISAIFPNKCSDKYDFYEQTNLGDLSDIYVKYRTDKLKNFICEHSDFPPNTITTDFRNKQGVLNIWKVFEEYEITFLIQIQGSEYRYCMIYGNANENTLREKMATELVENNLWFTNCISKYPKAQNYISKNFCGYKPNFIYKYQTLGNLFKKNLSEITYKEIAEQINHDIAHLTNNKYKIVQIIAKNI